MTIRRRISKHVMIVYDIGSEIAKVSVENEGFIKPDSA